ncbi:hypothetical protein AO242_19510 [Pseudomonas sp. ICMP 561]|nr:hypothetical protein AO242_19510 [Pseudomonas sp. ICMP 561]
MLFAALPNNHKFNQIGFLLFRFERRAHGTAVIHNRVWEKPVLLDDSGFTNHFYGLTGICLYFELREAFYCGAVGHLAHLGNPAKNLATTGIDHTPQNLWALIRVSRTEENRGQTTIKYITTGDQGAMGA